MADRDMTDKVIAVKDLEVRYQTGAALDKISFDVTAGDYIGVVGPNGSGKTTLLKALLNLIPASQGEISFFGKPLKEFNDWKRVGYLPQKALVLNPRFPATAEEVVASGLLPTKSFPRRANSGDRQKIIHAMDILKTADLRNRMIGQLSGGQQQRLFLARALVHSPEILLLDEPTVALDPQSRETFYAAIQDLNREQRITVLLVSHDTGTVGKYANKLMYLDREVVFYGDFDQFCHSPDMTDYFGKSAQHLICHRH